GFSLLSAQFAATMMAAVLFDGHLRRFLETKPLLWLGRWSYCMYLFHWPIAGLVFYLFPDLLSTVGAVPLLLTQFALTIAFAAASYAWIEKPILDLKRPFDP